MLKIHFAYPMPFDKTPERATPNRLRIQVHDLKPRDRYPTEKELQQTLKRLGGQEGARCEATCDCMIGLVCRGGVCTGDW